jgi:hypothetical protein
MAQIGCYMCDAEIEDLENYAKSMEITRTAVFALAVQRELQVRHLKRSSRRAENRVSAEERPGDTALRRVTVHVSNASLKAAFTDHVRSLGMGSDEGALALLRLELRERWLFKIFGWN